MGQSSSKVPNKNPAASISSEVPAPVDYGLNHAPSSLPTANESPNPSPYQRNLQPYPNVYRDATAGNVELKARIQTLDNAFRKSGNDSQNVTPTMGKTKTEHTIPANTPLDSALMQQAFSQPKRLMSKPTQENDAFRKLGNDFQNVTPTMGMTKTKNIHTIPTNTPLDSAVNQQALSQSKRLMGKPTQENDVFRKLGNDFQNVTPTMGMTKTKNIHTIPTNTPLDSAVNQQALSQSKRLMVKPTQENDVFRKLGNDFQNVTPTMVKTKTENVHTIPINTPLYSAVNQQALSQSKRLMGKPTQENDVFRKLGNDFQNVTPTMGMTKTKNIHTIPTNTHLDSAVNQQALSQSKRLMGKPTQENDVFRKLGNDFQNVTPTMGMTKTKNIHTIPTNTHLDSAVNQQALSQSKRLMVKPTQENDAFRKLGNDFQNVTPTMVKTKTENVHTIPINTPLYSAVNQQALSQSKRLMGKPTQENDVFRKLGNDFQNVTPTMGMTKTKNIHTIPTNTHLDSAVNQQALSQSKRLMVKPTQENDAFRKLGNDFQNVTPTMVKTKTENVHTIPINTPLYSAVNQQAWSQPKRLMSIPTQENDVFRKLGNDFQNVTPTMGMTKTKNIHMIPTNTPLDSALNQQAWSQPMNLMSIPTRNPFIVKESQGPAGILILPAEFKNSHRKPKNKKRKSSTSLEKVKTGQKSSSKSTLISDAKNIPLKGQQNPKNKGQPKPSKNKKDQESSSKFHVETLVPGAQNIDGEKGENDGGNIPLKGQQNPKNKGQPKPSKNKKDQESSSKFHVETLVPGAQNIDGEKGENDGGNIPLKGQQNPKNKGQPKPSKKPLNKSNLSATANDITLAENSLPKGHPKLMKKTPSQEKRNVEKSKVWNMYVIINADIDITLMLSSHLDERLKHKIKFQVQSVTKDETTGYVRFLLNFASKHNMSMAKRLFNSSNKNNAIKIDCKGVGTDNRLQDKPIMQENNQESQNATAPQQHEQKIENVRKEITSLMSSVMTTFSSQEAIFNRVKALEHKEKELLFQLAEYKNARNDLEMQLKRLQKDEEEDSVEKEKVLKKLDQEQKFLSKALPVYAIRTKITETVLKNEVTILMGNCGSGKSTQLVQYLMETSLVDEVPIVCTEPSEMQALSMAKYVAGEVNSSLGDLVGFSSEKDIQLSIYTSVLFMSEHELLAQFQKMNSFDAYSCIIIDEAQERTVYTDLLLGLLKLELSKKKQLRIVIVTAPSEIGIYESFFTDSVLLEVKTCLFPVQVIWSRQDQEDKDQFFKKSPVERAFEVHCTENEGDILVFVPSVAEALECCTDFKSCFKENNYVCLPLHSGLSYEQLNGIYRPLSLGKRKIIFATSCADVMIAVPNVRYVIDTGMKKGSFLESGNEKGLPISFITQDLARRRKERAGSSFAGKCYRLYSPNDFKGMKATEPDEMSLAGSIEKSVMNLLKLEVDPMKFEFPKIVPEERISNAMRNLESLGAVLDDGTKYKMTDFGAKMVNLPFRFQITWMLLEGIKRGMVMESIALASLSDLKQEIFCTDAKYNESMQVRHQELGQSCDSIALRTLRVLAEWYRQPKKEKASWGAKNFLDVSLIKLISSQMHDLCKTLDVKYSLLLPINDINDLEKLIDEALTKFNSSLEEHN